MDQTTERGDLKQCSWLTRVVRPPCTVSQSRACPATLRQSISSVHPQGAHYCNRNDAFKSFYFRNVALILWSQAVLPTWRRCTVSHTSRDWESDLDTLQKVERSEWMSVPGTQNWLAAQSTGDWHRQKAELQFRIQTKSTSLPQRTIWLLGIRIMISSVKPMLPGQRNLCRSESCDAASWSAERRTVWWPDTGLGPGRIPCPRRLLGRHTGPGRWCAKPHLSLEYWVWVKWRCLIWTRCKNAELEAKLQAEHV